MPPRVRFGRPSRGRVWGYASGRRAPPQRAPLPSERSAPRPLPVERARAGETGSAVIVVAHDVWSGPGVAQDAPPPGGDRPRDPDADPDRPRRARPSGKPGGRSRGACARPRGSARLRGPREGRADRPRSPIGHGYGGTMAPARRSAGRRRAPPDPGGTGPGTALRRSGRGRCPRRTGRAGRAPLRSATLRSISPCARSGRRSRP